jgi:hypothetical protein
MKLFVASDIHSFFTIFHNELKSKGFEEGNPNHLLIICGDVFDRGPESVEMYGYINNLKNVVLVRGNHEDLLEEMLDRRYGLSHDYSNGTIRTVADLADLLPEKVTDIEDICDGVKELITPFLLRYQNYFETKNYVFVHGYIPLKFKGNLPAYYTANRKFEYDPDWRSAGEDAWNQARWINGVQQARKGLVCDKTVVVGHWHCSWGHYLNAMGKDGMFTEVGEYGPTAIWEPYHGDKIIAIDRCTAYTNECNILVLEDELLDEE